ncbi:hypothetical protein DPMN_149230 [Dreissena polymorpha]|uniref:Uncharacterized protein n=1 Tax=Dreissena polymorpha TaxID=45954 RepID=A0A9D4FDD3_DREPO|nr:hypothetical protein DPMN_149230 [Dreissena polymorpha]
MRDKFVSGFVRRVDGHVLPRCDQCDTDVELSLVSVQAYEALYLCNVVFLSKHVDPQTPV